MAVTRPNVEKMKKIRSLSLTILKRVSKCALIFVMFSRFMLEMATKATKLAFNGKGLRLGFSNYGF